MPVNMKMYTFDEEAANENKEELAARAIKGDEVAAIALGNISRLEAEVAELKEENKHQFKLILSAVELMKLSQLKTLSIANNGDYSLRARLGQITDMAKEFIEQEKVLHEHD